MFPSSCEYVRVCFQTIVDDARPTVVCAWWVIGKEWMSKIQWRHQFIVEQTLVLNFHVVPLKFNIKFSLQSDQKRVEVKPMRDGRQFSADAIQDDSDDDLMYFCSSGDNRKHSKKNYSKTLKSFQSFCFEDNFFICFNRGRRFYERKKSPSSHSIAQHTL